MDSHGNETGAAACDRLTRALHQTDDTKSIIERISTMEIVIPHLLAMAVICGGALLSVLGYYDYKAMREYHG